jgi:hypothetical protein
MLPAPPTVFSGWYQAIKSKSPRDLIFIKSTKKFSYSRWGQEASTFLTVGEKRGEIALPSEGILFFWGVCGQVGADEQKVSPLVKLRSDIARAFPSLAMSIHPIPHPFYPLFAVTAKWPEYFKDLSGVLASPKTPVNSHWLWSDASIVPEASPCFILEPTTSLDGLLGDTTKSRGPSKEYSGNLLRLAASAVQNPLEVPPTSELGVSKLSVVKEDVRSRRAVYGCVNTPLNALFRPQKQEVDLIFRRRIMIDAVGSRAERALDLALGPVCGLCGCDGHGGDKCWMPDFYAPTELDLYATAGAMTEVPFRPQADVHRRWWVLDKRTENKNPRQATAVVEDEDDDTLALPIVDKSIRARATSQAPPYRGGRGGGGGGGASGSRGGWGRSAPNYGRGGYSK